MLPALLGHFSTGTSTQSILHYVQLVRSHKFLKFYYGPEINLKLYKSTEPPAYKLENIRAPVALHYAINDQLDAVVDVEELKDKLPNLLIARQIPDKRYNHMDLLYAINAREKLFEAVLQVMKEEDKQHIYYSLVSHSMGLTQGQMFFLKKLDSF